MFQCRFDSVFSKQLEFYLKLLPLVLYKPRTISLQRSQVVHFVFKNATTSVISLRGKKIRSFFLVLDKISKNKKDRGRRKKTKMTKGLTVRRSCGGETSGK